MKIFSKSGFLFCAQHEINPIIPEHSSKCLYAHELKPASKMSICSVVSNASICSSNNDDDIPSTSLGSFSNSSNSNSSGSRLKSSKKPTSYKNSRRYCCRRSESILLNEKHPNKIPLIIERFTSEKKLRPLERCQFVLPVNATVGQLQHVIRSRVCDGNMSIYIMVGNGTTPELPALNVTMEQLARRNLDDDGFLYIKYSSEDTLG